MNQYESVTHKHQNPRNTSFPSLTAGGFPPQTCAVQFCDIELSALQKKIQKPLKRKIWKVSNAKLGAYGIYVKTILVQV